MPDSLASRFEKMDDRMRKVEEQVAAGVLLGKLTLAILTPTAIAIITKVVLGA